MKPIILFLMLTMLYAQDTADPEHPLISSSSKGFQDSRASSIKKLAEIQVEGPSSHATSTKDFDTQVQNITAETPILGVSPGQRGVKYDVILQPGHYGRKTGAVGTSGKSVSERALVAYITNIIAESLRGDHHSVLVVSADDYLKPTHRGDADAFDGLRAKVFLAIHADGSVHPCSTGPSLGYQSKSSFFAMNAVAYGLAAALGYKYSDFNHDNFTANEAQYYMFRQVQADQLTGLLEIGELTCERAEKKLISSSDLIGHDVANGIDYVVRTAK
jgi:N-acetylmuramoyl-L-alanine amidase